MAGYIEKIKAAGGETWTIKDPEAPRKNEVVDLVYPVGSIYMSVNAVDPGTILGGTWEQIKDRFLLSAGDSYEGGTTGGEAKHTLKIEEMPSHGHGEYADFGTTATIPLVSDVGTGPSATGAYFNGVTNPSIACITHPAKQVETKATGGEQPHNNMPPYLTVYMWKRTA